LLAMAGASASKDSNDVIDDTLINNLTDAQKGILSDYKQVAFKPFDPVGKKTVATLAKTGMNSKKLKVVFFWGGDSNEYHNRWRKYLG